MTLFIKLHVIPFLISPPPTDMFAKRCTHFKNVVGYYLTFLSFVVIAVFHFSCSDSSPYHYFSSSPKSMLREERETEKDERETEKDERKIDR